MVSSGSTGWWFKRASPIHLLRGLGEVVLCIVLYFSFVIRIALNFYEELLGHANPKTICLYDLIFSFEFEIGFEFQPCVLITVQTIIARVCLHV